MPDSTERQASQDDLMEQDGQAGDMQGGLLLLPDLDRLLALVVVLLHGGLVHQAARSRLPLCSLSQHLVVPVRTKRNYIISKRGRRPGDEKYLLRPCVLPPSSNLEKKNTSRLHCCYLSQDFPKMQYCKMPLMSGKENKLKKCHLSHLVCLVFHLLPLLLGRASSSSSSSSSSV